MDNKNSVPRLKSRAIEQKALGLLENFSKNTGKKLEIPVPVFDIIEYLEYDVDFRPYEENEDILGETYLEDKMVAINENLERQDGRMHFTAAHEIGHIILHAPLKEQTPGILCRKAEGFDGNNKNILEWQADKFAAFLLMPTEIVKKAFFNVRKKPIYLKRNIFLQYLLKKSPRTSSIIFSRKVIEAGNFTNVSKLAMVNRLIGMGLIRGLRYQKNKENKS